MPIKNLALAAFIGTIIILYFVGGGDKYLSIRLYQGLFEQSPIATAAVFSIVFLVGTSFSLPVTGALAVASGLDPIMLAAPAALAASCAFMLPVATPPNAIVYASERVPIGAMVRAGLVLNVMMVLLITAMSIGILKLWGSAP